MFTSLSNPLCMKAALGLSPATLLSHSSREKCIANISRLPTVNLRGDKMKYGASAFIPVCVENGEVCLLYTMRTHNFNRFSCQVTFPGGNLEKDENVFASLIRELEDNLGVQPKDLKVWTKMGQVQLRKTNVVVTPVVGEILNFDINNLVINEDEVDEVFTIPMQVFCDRNNHGSLRHNGVLVPVYSGGKHKVWGITATITHRFLYTFLPKELYNIGFFRKQYTINELVEL